MQQTQPAALAPLATPTWQVTLAVAAMAVMLAVTAWAGPVSLALGVVVLNVVLAWGWAGAWGLPTPRGTAGVLLGATALLVGSAVAGPDEPVFQWLPAALSGSVILTLAHQLFRRDGRPRLVESVSHVAWGLAILTCGVLLIPLADSDSGQSMVLATMAAAVASAIVGPFGRWQSLRPWLVPGAMLGGGVAALGVGLLLEIDPAVGLVLGVAVGAVGHAVREIFSVVPTMAHLRPRLVAAASSVLVTGAVAITVTEVFLPDTLPT